MVNFFNVIFFCYFFQRDVDSFICNDNLFFILVLDDSYILSEMVFFIVIVQCVKNIEMIMIEIYFKVK